MKNDRVLKQVLYILVFFALTGCFSRPSLMTREVFNDIQVGSDFASLQSKIGRPYAVNSLGEETEEYEYIERMDVETYLVIENHYFLTVTNGQVVGKRVSQERSPAYDLIYREDPNYDYYNYFP